MDTTVDIYPAHMPNQTAPIKSQHFETINTIRTSLRLTLHRPTHCAPLSPPLHMTFVQYVLTLLFPIKSVFTCTASVCREIIRLALRWHFALVSGSDQMDKCEKD